MSVDFIWIVPGMKTRPEGAKWINDSWEGEVLEQTW
jgi:hypothetical protein